MAEKSKKMRLRVVTPTKSVFDAEVDKVILHATDGQMGVLIGHEPITTILGLGPMRIYIDEQVRYIAVFGGFAEINQQGITVLAETAECPEEIDKERAKLALERAERRIKEREAHFDEVRARNALRKASVRLELSGVPMITQEKK
jgi:F-type H+-transporting ATPase subunit epsilon